MKREYGPLKRSLVLDLHGAKYGRLTVVSMLGSFQHEVFWLCSCECGRTVEVSTSKLNSKNTVSCGCAKRDRMQEINAGRITHGKSGTRAYAAWANMMARVYDQTNTHYKRYGGRGLVVEDRFHNFEEFYAYMGDPPDGLTLERSNNEIGYVTGNLVWATQAEQQRNKSTNIFLELEGERLIATDVAKRIGIPYHTLIFRHHQGMSVDEIVSIPHNTKTPVEYEGKLTNLQHVCDETGIPYQCLWARINRQGLTLEAAIAKGRP